MKQFQFRYTDSKIFDKELRKFKEWCTAGSVSKIFFQIYTEILEQEKISDICGILEQTFPDAMYMGCSTSGNIADCQLSGKVLIVCTVFDLPSTRFALYQYDFSKSSAQVLF